MAQNREIGELGQVVTVNTAAESVSVGNTVIHTIGITVGNTSIHSNGITISGQSMNNTSYPGTANNTLYVGSVTANDVVSNTDLQANLVVIRSDIANSYSNTVSYISSSIETANAAMVANAAAAYSNSVTYTDTKIFTANAAIVANASAAYSNAVSYTDNAYSNAVSYINSSIGTSNAAIVANASAAYSNAVTYTDTKIGTANLAIADAYSNSVSYTDSKIATANLAIANAYSNAISYADSKIATANSAITANASAAYSNAVSYTDSKIATANLAIADAYSNSVSYTDSKITTANSAITANASAAYSNSVSYTDSKIATANAAISSAYSNSVSYTDSKIAIANSAITANASAAYSNATTYASNASNISSGTVAEARLPYRMDQNVRTSDSVEFKGMTLTGNLVVSGNVNIVGANNLSLVDNMIYLNSNSTVSNPDLGFAGNYNDGTYRHTGFFRDASDGIWKVFDNYGPEPDASPYIDTSNTTFHLANFQANNYFAGNTTSNWFVANNSGAYATKFYDINNTAYYLDPASTSLLNGLIVGYGGTSSTITMYDSDNGNRFIHANSGRLGFLNLAADGWWAWNDDSGNWFSATSSRSPIFYDSDNTAYYIDAASTSVLNAAIIGGHTYSSYNTSNIQINTAGNSSVGLLMKNSGGTFGFQLYGGSGTEYGFLGSSWGNWDMQKTVGGNLYLNNNTNYYLNPPSASLLSTLTLNGGTSNPLNVRTSSAGPWAIHLTRDDLSNSVSVYNAGGYWYFSSYVASGGSFRAPIFYDSDNTAYYIDPNNTSSVLGITLNGKINFPSGSGGGTTFSANHYSMGEDIADGGWSHPHYSDLIIGYHTGIRIGASYSGIRFYNNSPTTDANNDGNGDGGEALLMTVGGHAGGFVTAHESIRSPIFYDSNNTAYYVDPNSTTSLRTVGSWRADSSSWDGEYSGKIQYHGSNWYFQAASEWIFRNSGGSNVFYVNQSGTIYAPFWYDSNNTARYVDPNSTTLLEDCRASIFYDIYDTNYYVQARSISYLNDIRPNIIYDRNDTYYYNDLNAGRRFAGRTYIHEWIEFVNFTGLYSPNNGAHFHPNDLSYGSWRSRGSRNGWAGIEFDASQNISLMINTAGTVQGFHNNAVGWRLYIENGTGHFPGNVIAYWSDRRLKENLRPIGNEATQILSKLTAYRFNWNNKVKDFHAEIEPGKEEIGLIAQEVQAAIPDAVVINRSANKAHIDGTESESEYLTINWNKITPLLVQALNDTTKELNELKQLLKDKGIL